MPPLPTSFSRLAAALATGAALLAGCGKAGVSDDGGDGGPSGAAFNFTSGNMGHAVRVAGRAADGFALLGAVLSAAVDVLASPARPASGTPYPLPLCSAGAAAITWTDGNADAAWSAGDGAWLVFSSCRLAAGATEQLDGAVGLEFTEVTLAPQRSIGARLSFDLQVEPGSPGTLRGVARARGPGSSFAFLPDPVDVVSASEGAALLYELACFQVDWQETPGPGIASGVALSGTARALGKIMGIGSAGLGFDVAGALATGALSLLSVVPGVGCADLGVPGGVGDSDGSSVQATAVGGGSGDVRLQLFDGAHRLVQEETRDWMELLHPAAGTVIDGLDALEVGGVSVGALDIPRQVGDLALDLALAAASGSEIPLCTTSGSYQVAFDPAPPLAAGHVATLTFASCRSPEILLQGSVRIALESVGGDPATDDYSLVAVLQPIAVSFEDDTGSTALSGAMRTSRAAAGGIVDARSQEAGEPLSVARIPALPWSSWHLTSFSLWSQRGPGDATRWALAGDHGSISVDGIAGALALAVEAAVAGPGPEAPGSGSFAVVAEDGSRLEVTVSAGGAVALGVDADGDGVPELTIDRTWDELR